MSQKIMLNPAQKKAGKEVSKEAYIHIQKLEKVTFRVESEIKKIWQAAANADKDHKSLSDWLRSKISHLDFSSRLTKKKTPTVNPPREYNRADPELIREIGRIGVNLNQMSYQINRANIVGQPIDVLSFISGLAEIQAELREALQTLHKQGAVGRAH
jgi:hypothetical protein